MPALLVGDIVLVTAVGNLVGQRTLTTFPFQVTAVTGIPDQTNAFDDLHAELNATTGILGKMRACIPSQYTMTQAWYQVIAPTRYRRYVKAVNTQGGFTGAALTANVQASITRVGEEAGRRYVGGVRIPIGTDYSSLAAGLVAAGLKTKLTDLAEVMDQNIITPVVVATYRPLVGLAPNPADSVPCFDAFPQDTVRVLRRRTVGLGE